MQASRSVTTTNLSQSGRCFLKRLDQRLRRERLCEVGDASGFKRGRADGKTVVPGDVDDRDGNSRSFEAIPQLYTRLIVQIDVENDTTRFFEIAVVSKSFRRLKQQAAIAAFPQQPFHAPQDAQVVIDDKNDFSVRHDLSTLVCQAGTDGDIATSRWLDGDMAETRIAEK
jgi:hypothetical protein